MVSRVICGGLVGLAVLTGSVSAQTVLYVDVDATDPPDGSSWCTAYRTLHEALAVAGANTVIRVADGTYTPDPSGLADPREATFQLVSGVTINGGYAGFAAPDPDARDIEAYPTILSGDIGAPDDAADNCYHVVTASGTDATAVLDGVTVTGGNANGSSPHNNGGGMLNNPGSPTVNQCTFALNSAIDVGGGMHNDSSNVVVTDCTFTENGSELTGGGMENYGGSPGVVGCTFRDNGSLDSGGGMHNEASAATVTECTFLSNSTAGYGGGMYNKDCGAALTLTGCGFGGNSAVSHGAGMYNDGSAPSLTGCTFCANNTEACGAGMYNDSSSPTLTNCVLTSNGRYLVNPGALRGAGMYNRSSYPKLTNCTISANLAWAGGSGIYTESGRPTLTNCIVWWDEISGSATITYSCVDGGWAGVGNINADPRFVSPPAPGGGCGNIHLEPGTWWWASPCIDAGDPGGDYTGQTDIDGDPRVLGGRVDMGADEYSGLPFVVAAEPAYRGTLPKTQANVIRLTFNRAVVLPVGPALQIEPIGGGADVGDQFDYSLETTSVADDSLKAVEVGSVLVNLTWYRVTPAAGFDVAPLTLELCTLIGDADDSGRVTTADYSVVKAHLGERDTDARYDLNGSGRVTTADYSIAKAHMGEQPKP